MKYCKIRFGATRGDERTDQLGPQIGDEIHVDLVVMGHKGHSRIARFVIGTTAQEVNAYSKASVLIVKPTSKTAEMWH